MSAKNEFAPGVYALVFREAAKSGAIDSLRILLANGVNVDMQDEFGKTALMYAAQEGHIKAVAFLLKKGANTRLKNRYGQTALNLARFACRFAVAELLEDYSRADQPEDKEVLGFSKTRAWGA